MSRTRFSLMQVTLLRACLLALLLAGSGIAVSASSDVLAVSEVDFNGAHSGFPPSPAGEGRNITWIGDAGDGAWSNPKNWSGGRVPGPADTACLFGQASSARVDAAFGGIVGGIFLGADYTGELRLENDLWVRGDLELAGGTLLGGEAGLNIGGAVRVSGGMLVTPTGAAMNAVTLEIAAPGMVRLGANGKLNLSGSDQPLQGDGLLDTTTYRPNSVEYTGAATADLTAAGPAVGLSPASPDGFSRLDALALNTGESSLYSAVIDPGAGYAYFGTFTTPGIVVKVDLATFTRVGALTLNTGENYLLSAVIDPADGYAYFGTSTHPGMVVKVDLATFTHAGSLTFNTGENRANAAVIDPEGGYAYFGTYTSPGMVVKVDLTTFTRSGALTLSAGENDPRSAVIDQAGGYAYFGTNTAPGIVVKVNLSDFTRTGALTLNAGEDLLFSAVIDPDAGYTYFGTWTIPGIVAKVSLATFTRTGALTLEYGEDYLGSAVVDPAGGYAYFGAFVYSGRVIQVNLADFTRTNALILNIEENLPLTAVIDPDAGYAYFGTVTSPGIVVKIGVGGSSAMRNYLPLVVKTP